MTDTHTYRSGARLVASLISLLLAVMVMARDVRTVEGHYVYAVPRNMTIEQAEGAALALAINDALAKEFGTLVSSESVSLIDGDTDSFHFIGSSLVKGEWLETIGTPHIEHSIVPAGHIITVDVKGKASPIDNDHIDLRVAFRQSGTGGVSSAERFVSGNRLTVDFASPVDGYIAIFMAMPDGNVAHLLPFAQQDAAAVQVKGGKEYTFFADNEGENEAYTLYTDRESEMDILYLLFSPIPFTKPYGILSGPLRTTPADEFSRWLSRRRTIDRSLQLTVRPIVITPTN